MAKKATDPKGRAQYLRLEKHWLRIAKQLDLYRDKAAAVTRLKGL